VETTVYCDPAATGQGLGSALYGELLRLLGDEGVHRAYAGVALPNEASVALHERFGFREVGTFREVGHKFGTWWDVRWYERALP
jgi:phosphinothricin acetyltransferase